MVFLSPARRARRPGEWAPGRAVTFIVTLAATRSVTLAARRAGMSRKSAYALKSRDRAFSDAWQSALNARRARLQGDEVDEVEDPSIRHREGDKATVAQARRQCDLWEHSTPGDDAARDRFFARLAARQPVPSPAAAADLSASRKPLSL